MVAVSQIKKIKQKNKAALKTGYTLKFLWESNPCLIREIAMNVAVLMFNHSAILLRTTFCQSDRFAYILFQWTYPEIFRGERGVEFFCINRKI